MRATHGQYSRDLLVRVYGPSRRQISTRPISLFMKGSYSRCQSVENEISQGNL